MTASTGKSQRAVEQVNKEFTRWRGTFNDHVNNHLAEQRQERR